MSLAGLIDLFHDSISYDKVDVSIETESRHYSKNTALHNALASLVGVLLATSGCPVLGKLKPMVRHHLPLASVQETIYRVLSMYLLAQYFMSSL